MVVLKISPKKMEYLDIKIKKLCVEPRFGISHILHKIKKPWLSLDKYYFHGLGNLTLLRCQSCVYGFTVLIQLLSKCHQEWTYTALLMFMQCRLRIV